MMLKTRKADKSDAEEIAKIMLSFYNMKDEKEAKKAFENEIKAGHHFMISLSETKAIGFASWIMHGLPKHGLCELDRIAFLPEYRGKGFGKILFENLIDSIKKFYKENNSSLRKLYVLTHKNNKNAQEFYKNVGFELEVVLNDHYYKNLDECVFSIFFSGE